MIGIIVSSAIYHAKFPYEKEKLQSEDYFKIHDAIPIDFDIERSTDEVLFVKQFRFNLTAVGGDAHHVLVAGSGMSEQEDWPYFSLLRQNETVVVYLPIQPSPWGVRVMKEPSGYFEFKINVDSREATGYITIQLIE